jgi:hypothetical protein
MPLVQGFSQVVAMPRAILKKGRVYLIEPLPPEWSAGMELRVEKSLLKANGRAGRSSDEWMDEVEALAAKIPAGQDDSLAAAIKQVRQEAKELARKGKR